MKRVGLLLLVLMMTLLTFTGCKQETPENTDVTQSIRQAQQFTARVRMTVNEKAYEYLIEKLEDTVVITATAPKSLENFQVMLKESEYSVSYYGIKFVTKELPENLQFAMGPVFQLLDVLKMEPGSQQPGRNGTVSVSYDVGGTQLECTFDSETKLPVKIVYNSDTTIEFLEFTNLTTQSADEQTGTQLKDAADAETGAPEGEQSEAETGTGEGVSENTETDADVRSAAAAAANSRPEVIIANEE